MSTVMLPQAVPRLPLSLKDNKAENWKLWKQMWSNFLVMSQLSDQPEPYKIALFQSNIGPDALVLYNSMSFTEGENDTVEKIIKKFDEWVIVIINKTYERYIFNSRSQWEGESIDDFVTALRTLSQNCNFCECSSDTLLRDRIIVGIRDNGVRKKLLEIQKLRAQRCVEICCVAEITETRMQTMSAVNTESSVHRIQQKKS